MKARLAAAGLTLLLGSCSTADIVGKSAQSDYTQDYRIVAKKLARSTAKPSWQVPVRKAVVDQIVPVPGQRLLVGLTDMTGLRMTRELPDYGPYVLYDMQGRRELWRHERQKEFEDYTYFVLATDPVILIQQVGLADIDLTALEPQTGKPAWRKTLGAGVRVEVEGGVLGLSQPGSITAIDLRSGRELWRRDSGQGAPARIEIQGPWLWVMDQAPRALSLQDGKQAVATPCGGAPAQNGGETWTPDGVLLITEARQATFCRANGATAWQAKLPGPPRVSICSARRCFVATDAGERDPRLLALDAQDGRVIWEQGLEGRPYSGLYLVGDDQLVFSRLRTLEWRDAETGALRLAAPIAFKDSDRLADRLVVTSDKVVVVAEVGVQSLNAGDGTPTWTFDSLGSIRTAAGSLAALRISQPASAARADTPNAWGGAARALIEHDMRRHDEVRTNYSKMSTGAISMARSSEQATYSAAIIVGAMNAAADMVARAKRGVELREKLASAIEIRASVRQAFKEYQGAIRDGYFIKPVETYSSRGQITALLIVELSSGKWTELVASPGMGFNVLRRFTQSVVLAGRTVVTNGPGIDHAAWEVDDRGFDTQLLSAVLGFALEGLPWKEARLYEAETITRMKL